MFDDVQALVEVGVEIIDIVIRYAIPSMIGTILVIHCFPHFLGRLNETSIFVIVFHYAIVHITFFVKRIKEPLHLVRQIFVVHQDFEIMDAGMGIGIAFLIVDGLEADEQVFCCARVEELVVDIHLEAMCLVLHLWGKGDGEDFLLHLDGGFSNRYQLVAFSIECAVVGLDAYKSEQGKQD